MRNPFVFGEAVSGGHFCNRRREVADLVRDMLDGQKVFLIAARRIGKTSIIKSVLEQLQKKGVQSIYFDLEGITTYKAFLETYLNKVSAELSWGDKIAGFLAKLLPGISFNLKIEKDGSSSVELQYRPGEQQLEQAADKIYGLPSKIAKKGHFVVVLDEFQEIHKLNGGSIGARIRSAIQHQRNVGYIFAGSRRQLLLEMSSSPESPFFKIGPVQPLGKMDPEEFHRFLQKKFKNSGITVTPEGLDKILQLTENIPYYVQLLAHECWDRAMQSSKSLSGTEVAGVFEECIKRYDAVYRETWSYLNHSKKQLLQAIAKEGGHNLHSQRIVEKYDISSVALIQKTLDSLIKDGRIDKEGGEYRIDDLLFKEWIARNTV